MRRLATARILSTLALSGLGLAWAQTPWQVVADRRGGDVLHVDTASRHLSGATVSVSALLAYHEPQRWGHKGLDFRSSRAVWELHCVERRYRTRGLVLYQGVMATGTVVHEQPGLSPWNSAPPGSIPADLMNWACR